MRRDAVFFGIAGVFFGLLTGWIIGSQHAPIVPRAVSAPQAQSAPAASTPAPPPLDEARAAALKATADKNPSDAATRVHLGDMYFDAERYDDASRWYEAALKIDPKNVDASTDLGITYYYVNQPDRAIAQFEHSLSIDPRHAKSLLNLGVVRAFGKEDLAGATRAWEQVLEVAAPGSAEAATAKRMLEGIRAHPVTGGTPPAKSPGQPE